MTRNEPHAAITGDSTTDKQQKKTRDRHKKHVKERARAASSDDRSINSASGAQDASTGDDIDARGRRRKKRKYKKRPVDRESVDQPVEPITSGRKRKRRYVGGYHHGGDDPDATFIQPEDNPTALPDDVARETQFVLADTKEGLRKQVKERFKLFNENLATFAQEKASVESRMRNLSGASADEVRALYRKVRSSVPVSCVVSACGWTNESSVMWCFEWI